MRLPGWFEWALAGGLVVAGVLTAAAGVMPSRDALTVVAAASRNPYCTGPVIVLLLVWGESLLRLLREETRGSRGWLRLASLGLALAVTARIFLILPEAAGDQWIARLYLAAAVGMGAGALGLAAYLVAAGLLPLRQLLAATGRWAGIFGPFVIFILAAGFGTAFIAHLQADVADVQLLQMDESLGFHAAMFFGSFNYVGSWLWDLQFVFYAGIGVLVMTVAGALYLENDRKALRRFLLAVILAGLFGWIGYWLLPAVGPTTAFPELFSGTPEEREAALSAALARTEPMTQPPEFPRDCAPSLHTACALLALFAAWRRRVFPWILPLGILSIVTTLTLCKHYTVDVIMAVPFSLFIWWLAAGCRPWEGAGLFIASLATSLVGLVFWAIAAPISIHSAWGITLFCLFVPAWAACRMRAITPMCGGLQTELPRVGPQMP
jgi:hypothetical protein